MHGEAETVRRDGLPYDNQIAALDEVLRMAQAQHPRLVDMNGESVADKFIEALRSARESVVLLQRITRQ